MKTIGDGAPLPSTFGDAAPGDEAAGGDFGRALGTRAPAASPGPGIADDPGLIEDSRFADAGDLDDGAGPPLTALASRGSRRGLDSAFGAVAATGEDEPPDLRMQRPGSRHFKQWSVSAAPGQRRPK